MSHRYRTGSHLKDGTIVVRPAITETVNGTNRIVDRGLRIKYRNGFIDLDAIAAKYGWTEQDLADAIARMEDKVANSPRRGGRGFYRDNPVASVSATAAEANQVVNCAAFWTNPDGSTGICGEVATGDSVPPTCAKHAPTKKEEAAPKKVAASASPKGK